jgi:hypothetical protein
MKSFTLRGAALGLASLGFLTACDRNELATSPVVATPALAKLSLEVSSASAAAGDRIAVSLSNGTALDLGGVQGTLRFNPSRLRYVGQLRNGDSDQILMINDKGASRGELSVVVADGTGIEHSQPIVFAVIDGGYAASLDFDVTDAVLNGAEVKRVKTSVEDGVQINAALRANGEASTLSLQDWTKVLRAEVAREPGEIRNGLVFGDTDFSGTLDLVDALYVINVLVGNAELIVGTDGTGPSGDRDGVVAANVQPFNLPGLGEASDNLAPGVEADGSRQIALDDALAIINDFVGNNQAVVGEIIPGRPTTPVSNRVIVTGNITTNTTWSKSNIYELVDEVIVTGGATLTIEAGTLVEGRQGTFAGGVSTDGSALYIARDGKINAVGTALEPIVFTCVGTKFKGCWGGVSILGSASQNRGTATSPVIPGRAETGGCVEATSEGRTTKLYGGCNDDDNSGVLRYARIEYAGFRFTSTNELNGLALYGVGRGTTIDHIQVHAGLDDGIEFFGGTVNAKYIYLTANSDDSFDFTESFSGNVQFVVVQQDSLDSDKGLEMDNNGTSPNTQTPVSAPKLYNFTVVGKQFVTSTSGTAGNNAVGGMHVRVGALPKMFNFIVQNFPFAVDIDDAATCTSFNTSSGLQISHSMFTQNTRLDNSDGSDPAGCGATEVDALNAAGTNVFPSSSPVLSPLNVRVPDFRPAFGTATGGIAPPASPIGAPAGFFDVTATYMGAVKPASPAKNDVPWYAGWTRGWATASAP